MTDYGNYLEIFYEDDEYHVFYQIVDRDGYVHHGKHQGSFSERSSFNEETIQHIAKRLGFNILLKQDWVGEYYR